MTLQLEDKEIVEKLDFLGIYFQDPVTMQPDTKSRILYALDLLEGIAGDYTNACIALGDIQHYAATHSLPDTYVSECAKYGMGSGKRPPSVYG